MRRRYVDNVVDLEILTPPPSMNTNDYTTPPFPFSILFNSLQELDFIRIKIAQELEVPHTQRIQALQAQLEEQRETCFSSKRELECCKAELEATKRNHEMEVSCLKEVYEGAVNELKEECNRLQDMEYSPDKENLILRYNSKKDELSHQIQLLKEEIISVSREKDEAVYALEACKSQREEVIAHLKVRTIGAETEKFALEQRMAILSGDCERKDSQLRILKASVEDLTSQVELSHQRNSDIEARFKTLDEDRVKEMDDNKRRYETEIQDLENEIELLTSRLHDREELVTRAQREASEMQVRAESVEGELRKSHQMHVNELKKRLASLEIELADEQTARRKLEADKIMRFQQDRTEHEILKSEVTVLKREKEVLHEKLIEADRIFEAENRKSSTGKREAAAKISLLEQSQYVLKSTIKELELKMAELSTQLEDAGKAKDHHEALVDALQREFANRATNMERAHKKKIEDISKKHQAALLKEGKRAEAYKEKCLEAHRRGKVLADAINVNQKSDE